jgi:hypothetical protein
MSRLLKLTNISTYIGALTKTGVGAECAKIIKGQVARWSDADAASVLTGHRIDKEGQPKPYFVDVTDSHTGAVDWDFSKAPTALSKAKPAEETAFLTEEELQAKADAGAAKTAATGVARRSQRQTPASAAA